MIAPLLCHGQGYHIHDLRLIAGLAVLIGLIPIIGYGILQIKKTLPARFLAWGMTVFAVGIVERFSVSEPAGIRMLLIIVALLWSMKAVVGVESRDQKSPMPLKNWLAFAMLWFGMRPKLFGSFSKQPRADWKMYFVRGLTRIGLGGLLLAAAWASVYSLGQSHDAQLSRWRLWTATAFLLPALSLLVHFGLFNMLVGFWRRLSINCTPLFRAPLLSTSLTEFWGKRWNLAFSEMTSLSVYRPIKSLFGGSAIGNGMATAAAFLFSGLLHELAISVPVQAGFGLPLLYFLLHGIGMLIENMLERFKIELLKRPLVGRVWTWLWVLLPLPILFHEPFLSGCVWPLIGVGV